MTERFWMLGESGVFHTDGELTTRTHWWGPRKCVIRDDGEQFYGQRFTSHKKALEAYVRRTEKKISKITKKLKELEEEKDVLQTYYLHGLDELRSLKGE